MPIYEFTREKEGTQETISANLSFRELEIYNALSKTLGRKPVIKELKNPDKAESSLYDIVARDVPAEIKADGAMLSFEEFRKAYEKLEKISVIEEVDGRIKVLPRKYSSHPVIFHGPGFYSTDNRKGGGLESNGSKESNSGNGNVKNSNGNGNKK
jgi:hypothetical protein